MSSLALVQGGHNRLDASDWNTTNRPSLDRAGLLLGPFAADALPALRLTSSRVPV